MLFRSSLFARRVVCAGFLATAASGAALAGPVLDRVKAASTLRVCIWPDYYGITWRDPKTQQFRRYQIEERSGPYGILEREDNVFWFILSGSSKVGVLDANTGRVRTWPTPTPKANPQRFRFAKDGRIWFGEYGAGKIGVFPAVPGVPVHSFWDIGRKDYTSIWFVQILPGKCRIVGFYQNVLSELPHYAEYLLGTAVVMKHMPDYLSRGLTQGIYANKGWTQGNAYLPHDGKVKEWGAGRTRVEQAIKFGLKAKLAALQEKHDQINASRSYDPWPRLEAIKVPTMWEQGLWDQEDMYGGNHAWAALEPKDADNTRNHLVIGPWRHSGANYDGSSLGDLRFDGDTARQWRRARPRSAGRGSSRSGHAGCAGAAARFRRWS